MGNPRSNLKTHDSRLKTINKKEDPGSPEPPFVISTPHTWHVRRIFLLGDILYMHLPNNYCMIRVQPDAQLVSPKAPM